MALRLLLGLQSVCLMKVADGKMVEWSTHKPRNGDVDFLLARAGDLQRAGTRRQNNLMDWKASS